MLYHNRDYNSYFCWKRCYTATTRMLFLLCFFFMIVVYNFDTAFAFSIIRYSTNKIECISGKITTIATTESKLRHYKRNDYISDHSTRLALEATRTSPTTATTTKTTTNSSTSSNNQKPRSSISESDIYSAIDDLLRKHSPQEFIPVWDDKILSDAIANFGRTIEILGETTQSIISTIQDRPVPGGVPISAEGGLHYNNIIVRVATPNDDVDIANLRLSVFSDFSPDMHNQFCFRSCQAIAARRMRGAVCVVATAAAAPAQTDKSNIMMERSQSHHLILGTAECSFHEFTGTRLGDSRLTNSILYITEVAVNPHARRKGIGSKLLSAINIFAHKKGIESLYLHVDVTNHGALQMYHKAGYREVDNYHPMYYEFTKSLNLHPGATKGRDHVLLCSNLTTKVNWCDAGKKQRKQQQEKVVSSLGFEIPA